MKTITRRAILARTPAAIAAASLPAIASTSADDARLVALADEYLKFNAWWNADTSDYSDDEFDARGKRSSGLFQEIMRTPAKTVRGVLAKVTVLIDLADHEQESGELPLPADADDEFLADCYDGDDRLFDDWAALSIYADLVRLSRAGGAS